MRELAVLFSHQERGKKERKDELRCMGKLFPGSRVSLVRFLYVFRACFSAIKLDSDLLFDVCTR